MADKKHGWLFWVQAIAAVLGLIVAANEVLAIVTDESRPLGRFTRSLAFFSASAVCDPDTSTTEEFDKCLQQGGVEPSHLE